MKPVFRPYERKPFDAERCTQCGICLSECPVLALPPATACQEITTLAAHEQKPEALPEFTRTILRACTACFMCNLVCPEDCRPANLFLDMWGREFKRNGLPERARFFLPYSRPNYRSYVQQRLSRKEQDALAAWTDMTPSDVVFYPGCNLLMTPSLLFSRLFDNIPIRGSLDYCCGEAYWRMGLYDHVEQAAARCTRYFKTLGVKTVYLACTGDLNMFVHVLPQFGGDFSGITFAPFLEYLHERLVSGAWPIVKRFDGRTITVQDACHTKLYDPDYHTWPRRILSYLGFSVREAPNHAHTALCCGIGSGLSHDAGYAKSALIAGQRACVRNLRAAGADCVGVYCSGCLEMLTLSEIGGKLHHIFALVQEAIGEKPEVKHCRTAAHLLLGIVRNQAGGSARFVPPPIE